MASPVLSLYDILVPDAGSAASPSFAFLNSSNTGFYSPASGSLAVSAGGTLMGTFSGTGLVVPGIVNATGQLIGTGTPTNDSASSGQIGEYIVGSTLRTSAVSLTSGTVANIATISLTAGDWEVDSSVGFLPAASTSITQLNNGVSTTSATLPGVSTLCVSDSNGQVRDQWSQAAFVPGAADLTLQTITSRVSLTATTTYYLVASATFTVSTMTAYGSIRARRER